MKAVKLELEVEYRSSTSSKRRMYSGKVEGKTEYLRIGTSIMEWGLKETFRNA